MYLLGKGSNLLVSDEGIRGVVISLGGGVYLGFPGRGKTASGAALGASLASVCVFARENRLSGLGIRLGHPRKRRAARLI